MNTPKSHSRHSELRRKTSTCRFGFLFLILSSALGVQGDGYSPSNGEPSVVTLLWESHEFVNPYRVFGRAVCRIDLENPQNSTPCSKELGWQGRAIDFRFPLHATNDLPDLCAFFLEVETIFTAQPVVVYAGRPLRKVGEIESLNAPGSYRAYVPRSLLRTNGNTIRLYVKDLRVGYGQPTQGFLLRACLKNKLA